MAKFSFSIIFLLLICTACSDPNFPQIFKRESSEEEFDMRISEDGWRYTEKVTIDSPKQNIVHDVPAHRNISKAYILEDFSSNSIVTRLPKERVCYIRSKSPRDPSIDVVKKSMEKVSGGNAVKVKRGFRVITTEWVVKGLADQSKLSKEIIEFCRGMKIYDVKWFAKDGANVIKGSTKRKRSSSSSHDPHIVTCTPWHDLIPTLRQCRRSEWITKCKFVDRSCYHFVTCTTNIITLRNNMCTSVHNFDEFMCCDFFCP